MIVARRDFPAKDLQDFASHVKANAQKLNMGHAGVGSIGFTCGLMFNSIIGAKPTFVPFNRHLHLDGQCLLRTDVSRTRRPAAANAISENAGASRG
jgi:tripartite-type tricarboxylate transporter receptor subunit TctC